MPVVLLVVPASWTVSRLLKWWGSFTKEWLRENHLWSSKIIHYHSLSHIFIYIYIYSNHTVISYRDYIATFGTSYHGPRNHRALSPFLQQLMPQSAVSWFVKHHWHMDIDTKYRLSMIIIYTYTHICIYIYKHNIYIYIYKYNIIYIYVYIYIYI